MTDEAKWKLSQKAMLNWKSGVYKNRKRGNKMKTFKDYLQEEKNIDGKFLQAMNCDAEKEKIVKHIESNLYMDLEIEQCPNFYTFAQELIKSLGKNGTELTIKALRRNMKHLKQRCLKFGICPQCGKELEIEDNGVQTYYGCKNCDFEEYGD